MRGSPFRVPLILLGVLAGLTLTMGLTYRSTSERRWQEKLAELSEWEAEFDTRSRERSVLYGESLEGEAWPEYELALRELRMIPDFDERAGLAWRAHMEGAQADRNAFLEQAAPALEHLRRASHLRTGVREIDWSKGFSHPVAKLLEVHALSNTALARFQFELERKRPGQAARWWLDDLQLARDIDSHPILIQEAIASSIFGTCAEVLQAPGLLARLEPRTLRVLAEGLRRVDEGTPIGTQAGRTEFALLLHSLETHGAGILMDLSNQAPQLWRYGFSWRNAAVDAAHRAEEVQVEYHRICSSPSTNRLAEIDALMAPIEASPNPFLRHLPKSHSIVRTRFEALARLRVLRMAIAYRLGEELVLDDPYGPKLVLTEGPARVRIHSTVEPRVSFDFAR